jgi:hypothetical protein
MGHDLPALCEVRGGTRDPASLGRDGCRAGRPSPTSGLRDHQPGRPPAPRRHHVRTDAIPDENHAHHLATAVTRDWSISTKQ